MKDAQRWTSENLDLQSFGHSDDLHNLPEAYQMGNQESAHESLTGSQ